MATLGATTAPTAGARSVVIGSKTAYAPSRSGYYFLKIVSKLQTLSVSNLPAKANLITRIIRVRQGTPTGIKAYGYLKKVKFAANVGKQAYAKAFADAFVSQTSAAINQALIDGMTANGKGQIEIDFIRELWAEIQTEQVNGLQSTSKEALN